MDKNEIVAWINLVAGKIVHLEQSEDLLLQTYSLVLRVSKPSPSPSKCNPITTDSLREQIYNLGVEHCDLIASLRQVDYDLALKLNCSFFHNMLIRLEQLRVELCVYDAKKRTAKVRNAPHTSYNRELVTKTKRFIDYYPGC